VYRRSVFAVAAALAMCLSAVTAHADLAAYFARAEPAYRWEKRGEQALPNGTVYDLHLVSQTWQGMNWEHRLQIFRPARMRHPEFCTLLNTGGSGSAQDAVLGTLFAQLTGSPFAILYDIPNQPLYGGKTEDALIVYTWQRFLATGDETWPLHFPMAKAVLKAMDAIQAFTREAGQPPIDSFIVAGASKRGWTTWLAGASRDRRIKAIVPMVIDVLNVRAQIAHQLKAYGKPSEQVADYSAAGMLPILSSQRGARLLQLEDPFSYRNILTLPKLIVLGTNDPYWTQDALNLYWDALKGPKWVAYIPNSGHGLEDRGRVLNTVSAFIRAVAAGKPFPAMTWSYQATGSGARLTLRGSPSPQSARLYRTTASTQDFRKSRWTSEPMRRSTDGFVGTLAAPTRGYAVMYGEATFLQDGQPYTLTTQVRVLGDRR
jgi:PhoPQ-activated pathogenicity-related protein